MTLRRVFEELKKDPRNALYFVQGHIKWLIHGRAIRKYYRKQQLCKDRGCFETNQCKICECPFNALALSSKKCKNENGGVI